MARFDPPLVTDPHDGYALVRQRDARIKVALNRDVVRENAMTLAGDAGTALAAAGITGMRVRVELHISDPDTCALTIVCPSAP